MPTLDLHNRRRHHRDLRHVPNPSPGPTAPRSPRSFSSPEKPNSKLLSIFLKAAVMAVVASCFFLFVGVASILLLLLQLFLAITASRNHRHHRHRRLLNCDESDLGYSLEDLRKLPRIRYAGHVHHPSESVDDCVVCLSNLMDGDWCRILPDCGHKFHLNCIDKWLIKVPFCPICRCQVRLTGGSIGAAGGMMD